MKPKAIVYNCSYNGLSIIQELSRHGVDCIAMDCFRGIGTFSRYARYEKCPDPRYHEKAFAEKLYQVCSEQKEKPVLIPTNDEWALVTAKYKSKLSGVAHVCTAGYDTVRTMLDKDAFYQIGAKRGYMIPETWGREHLESLNDDLFPVVAKAKYKSIPGNGSARLNNELEKNRLVVLEDRRQLETYIEEHQHLLPHLVFQEYIRGASDTMYTVGIYADRNHEVQALFTGRKIRGYPPDIGDNIVGQSWKVPNELIENTRRIIKEMKFSGIAEFEYKQDSENGRYRLIEINPRPWSWIGITPHCGVNIPLVAYNDLCGFHYKPQIDTQQYDSIRYVKAYQDFLNCTIRYRFNQPEWAMSPLQWYRETKKCNNVYAELHRWDYPVSLMSFGYVITKMLRKDL